MPPTGLRDWADIKSDFRDCLLLGNGASIAIHEDLEYKNLLNKARRNDLLTSRVEKVFKEFNTSNFEYVLNMLWLAHSLNKILGVKEKKTDRAYESVRDALMRVIKIVHPAYTDVQPKLNNLSILLGHFKTALSLNYDLIIYWTLLYGNEYSASVEFKDCFLYTYFAPNWRQLRKPRSPAKRTTLAFYPHGNMIIVKDIAGNERKVVVQTAHNLLEQIREAWETNDYMPVFVSEGKSEQKLSAIYRSSYLTTVYEEVLPTIGASLATFGWSFGDQDDHILAALSRGKIRRIAVSIHKENPEWRTTRDRVREKVKRFFSAEARPEILFFDSATLPLADSG